MNQMFCQAPGCEMASPENLWSRERILKSMAQHIIRHGTRAQKNIIRKVLTLLISWLCLLIQSWVAEAGRHKTLLLWFILLKFVQQTSATCKQCLHLTEQNFNKTRFRNWQCGLWFKNKKRKSKNKTQKTTFLASLWAAEVYWPTNWIYYRILRSSSSSSCFYYIRQSKMHL